MKQLNLSRNHIQHISRKAFDGLTQLKLLDLSYNHIKYLLNDIFLGIPRLEILILSGNDFSRIKSGPLLEAPSLKVLYLSQCRIDNLKVDTFTNIPNIVGLDLSGNYLAQLETAALSELQNLEKIDLSRNRWHCDNKTKELITWLTDRNIVYTQICEDKNQINKDEEEFSIKPSDAEIEILDGSKFWPDEDKQADMNEKLKFQNNNEPTYIIQKKFRYLFYISHLFDAIPSFWAFAMGFQVGTVIAIFGTLLVVRICRRTTRQPRPPGHHRRSLRRQVRMRSTGSNGNPWTELQTLDCPDTPPPPYKDINVPYNNVLTYT
ncbi:SLIT and NTRK-like protein 6 isoform X2 [Anabrus simplex]